MPLDKHGMPLLKWVTSLNFSERKPPIIDLIVIHDCQGGYVGSIATFQQTKTSNPVSAHLVLKEDGSEVTQMVPFAKKAWHCVSFNSRSIGIEMAGFKEKGFSDPEWESAARLAAYLCFRFKIPVKWAKTGTEGGICRHYDLGRSGGSHTDPTTDLNVWNSFMKRVENEFSKGNFPAQWGR